jgi:hypothetical protein
MQDEFEDFKLRVPKAERVVITDFYQAWELIKDAKLFYRQPVNDVRNSRVNEET